MKQLDKINTTLFLTPDEYARSGLTKFFKETLGVPNVHKMEILINDGPEPRVAIELEYFKASESSYVTDKVSEQRFMERAAQINERMKEESAATSSLDETKKKSVLIDTSKFTSERGKENLMMSAQLAVHDLGLNDKIKFAFLKENPDIVRISRIDEGEEPQQAVYTYF